MNLNVLEKVARQALNGKSNTTGSAYLSSAEQRALASQSWKVKPGASAGTFAMVRPNSSWG